MSVLKIHLTYQCSAACEHCRFWCTAAPGEAIDHDLAMDCIRTLQRVNGLDFVVLTGGEPGLVPELTHAIASGARQLGMQVRVESNASWATSEQAARAFLEPLYQCGARVCFSMDAFHEKFIPIDRVEQAVHVSDSLGGRYSFEVAFLDRENPSHPMDVRTAEIVAEMERRVGHPLRVYRGGILFKGRPAERLAGLVAAGRGVPDCLCEAVPWWPNGWLRTLDVIILDPRGNLSKGCGIIFGNVRRQPVEQIVAEYDAEKHPIFSVLLTEGPLGLARRAAELGYQIKADYADRCHLCQEATEILRATCPDLLAPFTSPAGPQAKSR